ncbi:PREDICTED: piggyBac transposable element-derived protein 3-like, partial [Rhagoletis zephyria]|uniref:piggyBac transposable element-derived protein 3-like n=1 Tax=Rhagoletis zephyria TaxID=28612 RepID=UPI0008119540
MTEYNATFARGFSLHEALALLEDDSMDYDSIALLPPINATADVTDEDYVDINNLPASQMKSTVELFSKTNVDHQWDSDDDIPLSEIRKNLHTKPKKSKKYHYEKEDLPSNDTAFEKNDEHLDITEHSPTSLFCSILNNDFIGILLISGYIPLPIRRLFWERSKDCNNELVCEAISRNKFEFIVSNIHCQDNNLLDHSDKVAKVRPLFTHLNRKFMETAYIEEDHSVDEAMVPYTGRHGCKQYIHGKQIRYGFKLW